VSVVIAGEGDLREPLLARIRETQAPVRLVGSLDRESMATALAAADAVAIPSVVDRAGNVDGLPNTLLEALASGRAVVASQVAGIPDVVAHEVNGLLVPPSDAAALAGALERLAREPATRERLARAARETALRRLTWGESARAFEEAYAQASALDPR
jgi:glycosyltransferase involved in cell wall biosynthesis